MALDTQQAALNCPSRIKKQPQFWIQEAIHGHRFNNDQEPYMILLETLSVCRGHKLGTTLPSGSSHEDITYKVPHQEKLRWLVFQERQLERIAADERILLDQKWCIWKRDVNRQYDPRNPDYDNFAYLDDRFRRRFDALLQAIRLIRSLEIDVMHGRRWSSQFVAVTGPDLLFADFGGERGKWAMDKRFFGRAGELVYLMLNRSGYAERVQTLLDRRLLSPDDPMNRVAAALSDPSDKGEASTDIGYLPLASHSSYERIASDWLAVLELERLPNDHLFDPLFRVTGLNLLRYLAERYAGTIGEADPEPIVADLTNGTDSGLRELSRETLQRHREAANRAVKAHVERCAEEDNGWRQAREANDRIVAGERLKELFSISEKARDLEEGRARCGPEGQLAALVSKACTRDHNNPYRYIPKLARNIGLATSRQRVGGWFAVQDAMLQTLVLATVTESLELSEFTAQLYDRYGLVIGPSEARKAYDRLPRDVRSFEGNLAALEGRLAALGLTKRLSDDCAFVHNPFRHAHERHR